MPLVQREPGFPNDRLLGFLAKSMGFVVKADLGLAPGSSYEDLGLLPL